MYTTQLDESGISKPLDYPCILSKGVIIIPKSISRILINWGESRWGTFQVGANWYTVGSLKLIQL